MDRGDDFSALEHDPERWAPVLGKGLPPRKRGSCSTNKLARGRAQAGAQGLLMLVIPGLVAGIHVLQATAMSNMAALFFAAAGREVGCFRSRSGN